MTERVSDRELLVRRSFNARASIVFKAWTTPELMMRWWAPESFGITFISAEMDVREGGRYRFVFGHPAADEPMAFVGRYLEVVPDARLVWTNEEGEDGAVTTVTFTERDGWTEVELRDLYPSKEALDAAIEQGSVSGYDEQLAELDVFLGTLETEG
ncbi:SRPBCC domain-containing protein [Pelagibacterium limicola]|uniref:SRPBCC domain-containing protein n=1 Tax=Pelagibacterium limicola TaxID=2791022 RepID=UPI001FE4A1CD|nr:SRPBCC domain-containing protein [Pelagibacterium limicola]